MKLLALCASYRRGARSQPIQAQPPVEPAGATWTGHTTSQPIVRVVGSLLLLGAETPELFAGMLYRGGLSRACTLREDRRSCPHGTSNRRFGFGPCLVTGI